MPNVKILFNKRAEKQIKLVLFCFLERKEFLECNEKLLESYENLVK